MDKEKERALLILKKKFNFNMSEFSDRVMLQKTTYLLKELNFPGLTKYKSYSWYIYGPYCSDLAHDAFTLYTKKDIKDVIDNLELNLTEENIINKYKTLCKKLKISEGLPKYASLELFASIIYFNKNKFNSEETFKKIKEYKPHLAYETLYKDAEDILKTEKLI